MFADLVVIALLGAMLLTAVLAWRGSRLAAVALALQSLAWLSVNEAAEGPILITFSKDHGLVLADLVTIAALIFAAVTFVRASADQDPQR